ncbi:hypothetical protein [Pseudomonas aeruginosa]|uniref:hypothetical protein n=1 Tax=Pseudomonas aeruginosa TaxID=287 RepID=UPI000F52E40C|nr:hypothetical protein [Pseudomonas aeruginosa]MCO2149841.1 hypothetical protein [Pseudomonas aeruginosa]RQB74327.1 hypothetical protein IPC440_11100 [Pseudomonas aeruginosa]
MSKHTPGPWEIERYSDGLIQIVGDVRIVSDDEENVTTVVEAVSRGDEANARLIAAAPELLEACQAFKRLYGRLWDVVEPSGSGFLSPESVKEYDAIHELMTAAIAKAAA